jgi:hypothetical protein
MATKKQSKSVAVIPPKGIVVGNWRERAAQSIAKSKEVAAKLPQSSGNKLSFKGGVISLAGNRLDNPLPLVILAYGYERTYYSTAYQPDVFTTPDCYSLDGVAPAANATVPQSDRCATCRLNEFGSSPNGKGKGCKEGAVFAAIHADALESPERILAAQIVTGAPSVINSKVFRSYMDALLPNGPSWSVITMLSNEVDPRTQYALSFQATVFDQDDDTMNALATRLDEAEREISKGYTPQEEAPKAPAKGAPARRRKF